MKNKPRCLTCYQVMTRFEVDGRDAWKCMNVNAHNVAQANQANKGGRRPGAGRPRKEGEGK